MKKIGLLCDLADDTEKTIFHWDYFSFCERYGQVTLIHPYDEQLKDIDLLVLQGGRDVHPSRYGEIMDPRICGRPSYNFDYFDQKILPEYIKRGTAVWGTCRGLQSLNCLSVWGEPSGTLYQHIDEPTSDQSLDQLVHWNQDLNTEEIFASNSRHHQSVKDLHSKYVVSLRGFIRHKKKGRIDLSIEGIRGIDEYRKVAACQFHPENLQHIKEQGAIQWVDAEIKRIMEQE